MINSIKRLAKLIKKDKLINTYAVKVDEDTINKFTNDLANLDDNVFYNTYYITKDYIVAYGTVSNVSRVLLNEIIDRKETNKGTIYTCFTRSMENQKDVKIHEDIRSSWLCLLEYMNNPKYLVIFKINTNETL